MMPMLFWASFAPCAKASLHRRPIGALEEGVDARFGPAHEEEDQPMEEESHPEADEGRDHQGQEDHGDPRDVSLGQLPEPPDDVIGSDGHDHDRG